MLDVIRRPLLAGDRMQESGAGTAEKMIAPNDRLTAFERLEVYNQQYWWRLISSFADDFPGVRAVVGQRCFDRLTISYLEDCPSRSWNLGRIGARFAEYLESRPELSAPHTALAADVARVESAVSHAFDAAEHERIEPQQLGGANPETLRLQVQPYVQLLELRYPADRLLSKLKKRSEEEGTASNAVGQRKARRAPRLTSRPAREPVHLAVHRSEYSVYYRRISPLAYHLLMALRGGYSLASACEVAMAGVALEPDAAAAQVREWFETFTALGWLCPKGARPAYEKKPARKSPAPARAAR
jgi:hypothetical protein